jgi:ABC-type protease/lipase transport system fused ATPase/permease subunit
MALFQALCHDPENPISILMVTHDPDLASNADRMLLLNNGKTEASDIRSAWGLDAEESPVAAPSEEETVADASHNGDAVEDVEAETDGATADIARENGGEEE